MIKYNVRNYIRALSVLFGDKWTKITINESRFKYSSKTSKKGYLNQ